MEPVIPEDLQVWAIWDELSNTFRKRRGGEDIALFASRQVVKFVTRGNKTVRAVRIYPKGP